MFPFHVWESKGIMVDRTRSDSASSPGCMIGARNITPLSYASVPRLLLLFSFRYKCCVWNNQSVVIGHTHRPTRFSYARYKSWYSWGYCHWSTNYSGRMTTVGIEPCISYWRHPRRQLLWITASRCYLLLGPLSSLGRYLSTSSACVILFVGLSCQAIIKRSISVLLKHLLVHRGKTVARSREPTVKWVRN